MLKQIALFSTVFVSALSLNAQTTILNEDFQQGIPENWTIVKADSYTAQDTQFAPGWIALADPDGSNDSVAGATSYFTTTGKASRWLITPPLTIGTYGNFLKWKARSVDPSYPDTYQVLVSTTDTQITSFNDTIFRMEGEWEDWTDYEIDMTAQGYSGGQTIYLAFVLETTGGFKLYLDDINVRKDDPLSLNEHFLKADISAYPNPTRDLVRFSSENTLKHVAVYSTDGNLVYSQENGTEISLAGFEPGVYLVRMTTNTGQIVTKRIQKL
ncbi:T9SS-dependent choice-of-anchor J family protein [Fluviicola sp.]|jgi:hypothetical protein|uniref:T9SS-dependent choice-of-anchor J family protein n=1 Tax=Fluviicola sp. TaxID=1917219 RepID=UPI002834A18B|nr:choice-of-anchor J domain-containing protein [Fluviicola sp.]MDR0802024.1 choice-of-anchor J domain-containing protein [Fluviicola sp.]